MESLRPEDSDTLIKRAEEHEASPYIFELKKGPKELLFFGSKHTNDPEDPMFNEIEKHFMEFKPEIVFVEGRSGVVDDPKYLQDVRAETRETAIKNGGEAELAVKLALESNTRIEDPEPCYGEIFNDLLLKGFAKDSIFAWVGFRGAEQYHRLAAKPEISLEQYISYFLKVFRENTKWENFDYSMENLAKVGEKIWGERGKLAIQDFSRVTPILTGDENETEINMISNENGNFRNVHILAAISETLKKFDRIMVVFGRGHAHSLESALRKLFETL